MTILKWHSPYTLKIIFFFRYTFYYALFIKLSLCSTTEMNHPINEFHDYEQNYSFYFNLKIFLPGFFFEKIFKIHNKRKFNSRVPRTLLYLIYLFYQPSTKNIWVKVSTKSTPETDFCQPSYCNNMHVR